MSQHDLTIDNQGFPAFRADLNNALQALGSTQSGTSAPSPTFANQLWYDTTNNQLKIRNEDNDAWITLLTLDQSADSVSQLATAIAVLSAGTAGAPALTTTGDTNTGIFFPAADTIAFAEGGAEVMRIDSSGRVGVGVTSPDGLLTLPATASSTPKIRLQSATSDVDVTITSFADASGTYATFGSNAYLDTNGDEAVFDSAKRSAYVRVDGRSQGAVMFGTATSGIPSERMRINNTVLSLTGLEGIKFQATQSASSDANTLDDYEEGTWLPTIESSSGAFGSVTYNAARNGYYTKIGRVVHIVALVYVTSYTVGTASNQMKISNLPFTAANLSQNFAVGNIGQYGGNGYTPSVAGANVFFRIEQNNTYGLVCLDTNTTFTDEAIGAFSTGGFLFRITATYITNTN